MEKIRPKECCTFLCPEKIGLQFFCILGGGVSLSWVDKRNISTFFPPSWSEARITYEVTEAFKAGQKKGLTGARFQETSPSGIRIQFSWDVKNQCTIFCPVGQ
ncbi:EndoU domain-containing protein [Variovorax sp. UMC13]|uniref:EndoU domain-containing protein n=1 Tax=Variovorax sp. UMC13 TaxID=1862326 RepID=UPI0016017C7F